MERGHAQSFGGDDVMIAGLEARVGDEGRAMDNHGKLRLA
jgi:hypothetical protein